MYSQSTQNKANSPRTEFGGTLGLARDGGGLKLLEEDSTTIGLEDDDSRGVLDRNEVGASLVEPEEVSLEEEAGVLLKEGADVSL